MVGYKRLEGHEEFHVFVGAFVTEYAQLELIMRMLIGNLSGLDQARYDAIVGFPRNSDLRKLFRKLVGLALDGDDGKRVIDALNWLDKLTKLRDRIVHYGGVPAGMGPNGEDDMIAAGVLISNKLLCTDPVRNYCDYGNLWHAVSDLWLIKHVFIAYLPGPKAFNDFGLQIVGDYGPWRYKPLPEL